MNDSIEFQDNSSLHIYRTEIPNIVFELDLDVYEFKGYCIFKKISGDRGSCYKSVKKLCEEIGCSRSKFFLIKERLIKAGLISVTHRKASNGGSLPDIIKIIDVWPLNMQEISKKNEENRKKEGGSTTWTGGVHHVDGGGPPRGPKEDLLEEDLLKEQQQQLDKSESDPPTTIPISAVVSQKQEQKKKTSITAKFHECLKDIDIPLSDKVRMSKKYPDEQIVKNAIEWATSDQTNISTTLTQAMWFGCKEGLAKPQKRLSVYEELCHHFTNGEKYKHSRFETYVDCWLNKEKIGFEDYPTLPKEMSLVNGFSWKKFEELCYDAGIDFTRQKGLVQHE